MPFVLGLLAIVILYIIVSRISRRVGQGDDTSVLPGGFADTTGHSGWLHGSDDRLDDHDSGNNGSDGSDSDAGGSDGGGGRRRRGRRQRRLIHESPLQAVRRGCGSRATGYGPSLNTCA
jgi:hypothetical protein